MSFSGYAFAQDNPTAALMTPTITPTTTGATAAIGTPVQAVPAEIFWDEPGSAPALLTTPQKKRLQNHEPNVNLFQSSSPIAWWKFDDTGSGTVLDSAGSHTGTNSGATVNQSGIVDQAFHFDGGGDHIALNNSTDWAFGSGDFTFAFWFNRDQYNGFSSGWSIENVMVGQTNANGGIAILAGNSANHPDKIHVVFGGGSVIVSSNITFTNGTWNHVAVTRSNNTVTLYLNGVVRGTGNYSTSITDTQLRIAAHSFYSGRYFKGRLDDMRVYPQALNSSQVADLFSGGSGSPPPTPTTASTPPPATPTNNPQALLTWWKLDETSGTTVLDSAGTQSGVNHGAAINQSGQFGTAYRLDGVNDYIEVADHSALSFGNGSSDTPFSISLWMNADSFSSRGVIAKANTFNQGEWYLYLSDNTVYFRLVDNSSFGYIGQRMANTLSTGTWYHIAATYNGSGSASGLKLYLNGTAVSLTSSSGGSYSAMENLTLPVTLGSRGSNSFFDGLLDDVRLYATELSPSQVLEIFSPGGSPTNTPTPSGNQPPLAIPKTIYVTMNIPYGFQLEGNDPEGAGQSHETG